ncbi:unnamed protein product [Schistocephalus solidus]|uniref:Alpha-carbonic anhydrase domain-containing protein n=1 Tax=Schistocephalus solidus TaxID=70667 RepID=A0A183SKL7_SCHSO|nr:unnamed protein product [Schistocephalus solidus]
MGLDGRDFPHHLLRPEQVTFSEPFNWEENVKSVPSINLIPDHCYYHRLLITSKPCADRPETNEKPGGLAGRRPPSEPVSRLMRKWAQLLVNSSTRTTYTTCPPKHKHQDFTQQGLEQLTSHMCDRARGHVKKEPSQPDSQTTSQPLHTKHVELTVRSECNCQLATFQPTVLIAP